MCVCCSVHTNEITWRSSLFRIDGVFLMLGEENVKPILRARCTDGAMHGGMVERHGIASQCYNYFRISLTSLYPGATDIKLSLCRIELKLRCCSIYPGFTVALHMSTMVYNNRILLCIKNMSSAWKCSPGISTP